jgi:SpoIIAA-like
MISIIKDAPANVAAFRATGDVRKADYDNIVIPTIDALVEKQDSINFLLVLDTSLSNFTIAALLEDLAVGMKHFTKWHKMAIVSESGAINTFTDLFSYIAPGEAKGFTHAQLDEATRWVSS